MKKLIFIFLVLFSVNGYAQQFVNQTDAAQKLDKLKHVKLDMQKTITEPVSTAQQDVLLAHRYILRTLISQNNERSLKAADISNAVNSNFVLGLSTITSAKRESLILEYIEELTI